MLQIVLGFGQFTFKYLSDFRVFIRIVHFDVFISQGGGFGMKHQISCRFGARVEVLVIPAFALQVGKSHSEKTAGLPMNFLFLFFLAGLPEKRKPLAGNDDDGAAGRMGMR